MNDTEQLQHETIKNILKQTIQNNPNLTPVQKQVAKERVDQAAEQADWIMEIMRMCGYL